VTFKRVVLPDSFFTDDELTRAMAGIGMRVSCSKPIKNPNIEDVLLSASLEGLKNDWRTLSLVVDWFIKHSSLINVDRLTRALIELKENELLIAFWSALAQQTGHDLRFNRMRKLYHGDRILIGGDKSQLLLKRNGEDQRFLNTHLVVPNLLLRSRQSDILDTREITQLNSYAYYRVMMGASYRSDVFATLNLAKKTVVPSDLARKCYCAFKTAWDGLRDWKILFF